MKCANYTLFLFSFLLLSTVFHGQVVSPSLCRPDVILYGDNLYAIGYEEKEKELLLVVRKLSDNQETAKEKTFSLGKKPCTAVHNIQSDTLHGYLNFLIQEVNNDKTGRLIRLDKKLNTVADIADAEITRVGTFTAYDNEYLYEGDNLYVVRPFSKDSINHFFLQKYTLKNNSNVFEYNTGWQISFGKQQYHRCHIMRADSRFVYLYVNVIRGGRQGQWVLFINARKGEILHAERLNDDYEDFTFLYSAHYFNPQTRDFCIAGYKLKKSQVSADYSSIHFPVGGLKTAPVFICTFDSSGFITERADDFVSIPGDLSREKEFKEYAFKVNKLQYFNNRYNLLLELVAGNPGNKAFKTYGFQYSVLEHNEENVLKPVLNSFICTYRDSKIKDAKNIFNLHELDTKANVDEFLYKRPVTGAFKQFDWQLDFSGDVINGYAVFISKTSSGFYNYTFSGSKWQAEELGKTDVTAFLKTFRNKNGKLVYFKNTSSDTETKVNKGLEAVLLKAN